MNTELRKNANNESDKDFFNSAFGKTMGNVRIYKELVRTNKRRNQLVSEPNYNSTKYFSENLVAIEMNKTNIKMNKPIYLGQSILDISKTLMYEFWYDYLKPKYTDNIKLRYADADSFVIEVKTEDLYADISADVKKWFDTSNYDEIDNRPLTIGINKKVPGLFKDELGGKIMTEFCTIRAKTCAFAVDDGKKIKENKKAIETKKCVIKKDLILQDYKKSLFNDEVIIKSQLRFKSGYHDVYTEKINKIALSCNDDKRIQTFDKITTYPYGTNVFKVCENEMINVCNAKEILGKTNKESETELYKACSTFLKYIKRMETKKCCKI